MKTTLTKKRDIRIDLLKTIAIISVVFYHIGVQTFGYLGVEIFLVINGYLIAKSIIKTADREEFSYFGFIFKKLVRLWPLALICAALCFAAGYFVMLPNDFENLSESVIASNFFGNNILACITTKNYWDVVNDFKPLMHFWYLGIIMQSYVILPVIPALFKKCKNRRLFFGLGFSVLTVLSLVLYMFFNFSDAYKFYYIPFRLFELSAGAALACFTDEIKAFASKVKNSIAVTGELLLTAGILCILLIPSIPLGAQAKLLLTCALTLIILALFNLEDAVFSPVLQKILTGISYIGKVSFSVFVWHQPVLAFMRYTVKTNFGFADILVILLLTAILSVPSYIFIEQKLGSIKLTKKSMFAFISVCLVFAITVSGLAFVIYKRSGVVRNVDELGISTSNIYKGMHSKYTDRIYDYDKDFESTDKIKVAIFGNSFGRDWGNILLESEVADKIEISFIFRREDKNYINPRLHRFEEADYVFFCLSENDFNSLTDFLEKNLEKGNLYIIGNKNFGDCNGIIYNRRNQSDYFETTVKLSEKYISQDNRLKEEYKDHYISIIDHAKKGEGIVRVFDDEGHYLSQDCRHLTQFGAKYFAKEIDLSFIK